MSDHAETQLPKDDAALARRIARVYAPPPMSRASQARFDAGLAERIASRSGRRSRRIAGVALATAAAFGLLFVWAPPRAPAPAETGPSGGGEVILALALGSAGDADRDLPDDYRAISALLAE